MCISYLFFVFVFYCKWFSFFSTCLLCFNYSLCTCLLWVSTIGTHVYCASTLSVHMFVVCMNYLHYIYVVCMNYLYNYMFVVCTNYLDFICLLCSWTICIHVCCVHEKFQIHISCVQELSVYMFINYVYTRLLSSWYFCMRGCWLHKLLLYMFVVCICIGLLCVSLFVVMCASTVCRDVWSFFWNICIRVCYALGTISVRLFLFVYMFVVCLNCLYTCLFCV